MELGSGAMISNWELGLNCCLRLVYGSRFPNATIASKTTCLVLECLRQFLFNTFIGIQNMAYHDVPSSLEAEKVGRLRCELR